MWKVLLVNLSISLIMVQSSAAAYQPKAVVAPGPGEVSLTVQAASTPSILFKTQNGRFIEKRPPEEHFIPHLVLKRDGRLTPGYERTLILKLSAIKVPTPGAKVYLRIETQHGDPDRGAGDNERITAWEQTIEIPAGPRDDAPIEIAIRFEETTNFQGGLITTPTDYFRTQITAVDREGRRFYESSTDYAFLMESQWQAPLPRLDEDTPGAAPRRLRVYFCDMFPFELSADRQESRVHRADVESYISTKLLPEMVRAVETQTNAWGFPWYQEWSNSRPSEDFKSLSVALTDSDTWFHGLAPTRGHAEISIRTSGMGEFGSLTDGIMSTFQHELFHNLQRNISLHFAGNSDIDGLDDAWEAISEGTAVLASSVGQPDVQFGRTQGFRPYMTRARAFIGSEGAAGGDLNASYKQISYHAAIYWRFLYEQCGGTKMGLEDQRVGMQVTRVLLETLYQGKVVDISKSAALPGSMPALMDRVFEESPLCPFRNYADSLQKFSLAIYGLKLDGGRCGRPALPSSCGFYDPNELYPLPPAQSARLKGGSNVLAGDIASSFGMDFIEIMITPGREVRSLSLQFDELSGPAATFSVQVLPVLAAEDEPGEAARLVKAGEPILLEEAGDGRYPIYRMDAAELKHADCMVLVITRLDPYEESNAGQYQLSLETR